MEKKNKKQHSFQNWRISTQDRGCVFGSFKAPCVVALAAQVEGNKGAHWWLSFDFPKPG